MNDYLKMLYFSRKQWPLFVLGVLFMLLAALFDFAQIGAIIPIVDKIFTNKAIIIPDAVPTWALAYIAPLVDKLNSLEQMYMFKALIVIFPIMYLFRGIAFYFKGLFMDMVAQKTMMDVKNQLYIKYQELSLDFYSKKRQGELMSRITNDVGAMGHSISYGLADTFYNSILVIGFTIVSLVFNWKLLFMVGIIFPIVGLFVHKLGKQLKGYMVNSQEVSADLNTLLAETIHGVRIIKGFSREEHEIERFKSITKQYYKFMMKGIRRMKLLSPMTELIAAIAIVVILLTVGTDVLEGRQSFGFFVGLVAALMSIMKPAKKVANAHGINQQGIAASMRVYDILDTEVKIFDKENSIGEVDIKNEISFKDVFFAYDSDDGYIIKDISHSFPIGQTTALVGPTGCGKSTMLNLISRFYDPQKGSIEIDGINLKDIQVQGLRSKIGVVTQDMILFHESIRDNLKYGKIDASDEEIIEACKQALAWDFIEKMPEGLDTVIGDRGFRLSGGQKQRLCIARAILRNPEILLLDEATSALDAESESLVQKALDNLMEGRTVLVVAHRLSTIKHASTILVMEDGKIVQKGPHDELLKISPLYKKLADLNFIS